jgi:hypothetical protein
MNAESFKNALDWDRKLYVGLKVEARWTNSGYDRSGPAEIVRLNAKSVRVKLLARIDAEISTWPVGHELNIPRFLSVTRWSISNCVAPLENDAGGPKYRRGDVIEGRGRVTKIWLTGLGYNYDCEAQP